MLAKVKDIARDVRIAIDQNSDNTPLIDLSDIDTLSMDDIVRSKITDAVKSVEKAAPVYLLGTGKPFAESLEWMGVKGKSGGRILLPDDFMRLISFKMSDWAYPLYEAITPDSPKYRLQGSRYGGLRGNPQKPVCAIVPYPQGLMLEFYSCSGGDGVNVAMAQYLPEPYINDMDEITISDKCYRAVVHYCAGLVCTAYQSEQQAEQLFTISKDLLK